MIQTDYLAVATEWHNRGFFTTPVKHGLKKPRFKDFNVHPAKNLSIARQNAYDYPHDDVGLVSRRGDRRVFWIDIDHHSVEDRIFRGTGQRLPRTLTTSSRPKTAPWKRHFCYRQTSYSVAQWRTEMTGIRDFTMTERDDKGRVPNLFDVKGCGGGGFVVAAGCWRQIETPRGTIDEQYAVTDDAPVIDVPDWLVVWVLDQYRNFRQESDKRVAHATAMKHAALAATTAEETERKVAEFETTPTQDFLSLDAKRGALVPKDYRNGFLKSLGGELASRGIPKSQTERMLQIATEVCEPFETEDKKDGDVQRIVDRLRIGNVWISRKQLRESGYVTGDVTGESEGLLAVLRLTAEGLPWDSGDLPSHLVNSLLRQAARNAGIDCGTEVSWKQAVSRALRGVGAKSKKSHGPRGRLVWVWARDNVSSSEKFNETGGGETVSASC